MRVTYNSPNRSHHVAFAQVMLKAGCLHKFVAGISRFSPRFDAGEFGTHFRRADHLQNLYLASMTKGAPKFISDELAYWSKIWLDWRSTGPASESDIFLFYSGAGLHTIRRVKPRGVRCVVEAVNSHVLVQESLLAEESRHLKAPPPRFHRREVRRRLAEYENADAVLCPSQFVKKSFISQGFAEENVFVVPYGFYKHDASQVTTDMKGDHAESCHVSRVTCHAPDDIFRVLYVGQIHIRKGLRYLIQAFERLRAPKKELLLVGPRTDNSGIDDLKLPDGVKFHGVARGDELARIYQSATVFVQPSIEEGLSLVLAEALSHGLPVIATENTGARDLFNDGVEGFIVPIRDHGIIAEKLQKMSDDFALRQRMSGNCRKRAEEPDGWERSGNLLLQSLQKIAASGSNATATK